MPAPKNQNPLDRTHTRTPGDECTFAPTAPNCRLLTFTAKNSDWQTDSTGRILNFYSNRHFQPTVFKSWLREKHQVHSPSDTWDANHVRTAASAKTRAKSTLCEQAEGQMDCFDLFVLFEDGGSHSKETQSFERRTTLKPHPDRVSVQNKRRKTWVTSHTAREITRCRNMAFTCSCGFHLCDLHKERSWKRR